MSRDPHLSLLIGTSHQNVGATRADVARAPSQRGRNINFTRHFSFHVDKFHFHTHCRASNGQLHSQSSTPDAAALRAGLWALGPRQSPQCHHLFSPRSPASALLLSNTTKLSKTITNTHNHQLARCICTCALACLLACLAWVFWHCCLPFLLLLPSFPPLPFFPLFSLLSPPSLAHDGRAELHDEPAESSWSVHTAC